MFSSAAIAANINFTFHPVPDYQDYGKDPSACTQFQTPRCCKSNIIEACVLKASGCLGGCVGASAGRLASFLGCFVKGERDRGVCQPDAKDRCLASAGISANATNACMDDKEQYEPVMAALVKQSRRVQTYPHTVVNGKLLPQDTVKNDEADLRKALCDAGIKAAC